MTTDKGRQLWLQRHGKAPKTAVPAPAPEPAQDPDTTPPAPTEQSMLTPRGGIDPDQVQDDDTRTTGSVARGRKRWAEHNDRPRWLN